MIVYYFSRDDRWEGSQILQVVVPVTFGTGYEGLDNVVIWVETWS